MDDGLVEFASQLADIVEEPRAGEHDQRAAVAWARRRQYPRHNRWWVEGERGAADGELLAVGSDLHIDATRLHKRTQLQPQVAQLM